MFTGFTEDTIRFFLDIRFHNDAVYFNANRERYERDVLEPFHALIEDMGPALLKIDPTIELRPYKALARLRRDTRFSKDKSPYRDHLWILFRQAARPREGSLFYWFELSPQDVNWGMGTWGENRPMMDAFRRYLAAKPEEAAKIIGGCDLAGHGLQMGGRQWARMAVPPGIPLFLRPWYLSRELYISRPDIRMSCVYRADLPKRILKDYQTMAPVYRLLRGFSEETDEQ